jgi:AcrR family transcriptional regulator
MQGYTQGMMMTSVPACVGTDASTTGDALPGLRHLAAVQAGRRDRKKQATRRSLRNAALELVASRGFAHVTVEDIAEAADVATRTFFNYFPSKESAVIGADPERIEEFRASLLLRPAGESPLEALGAVLVEYAGTIDEDFGDLGEGKKAWFQRFCAVRSDPDLLHAYAAHMAEIEQGLATALAQRLGTDVRHDPYPALVTAATLGAARVAAMYWSANGGEDSLARLTASAIDRLAKGLAHDNKICASTGQLRRGQASQQTSAKVKETSTKR